MPREPMPTPVQPFIVNARDYESPDYLKGAVMRIEGKLGRPRGVDEEGNPARGFGLLGEMQELKERLGRMPGTHGVDDEGDGIARHVFEQRARSRRANGVSIATAVVAFLVAATTALNHFATAAPPQRPAPPSAVAP